MKIIITIYRQSALLLLIIFRWKIEIGQNITSEITSECYSMYFYILWTNRKAVV